MTKENGRKTFLEVMRDFRADAQVVIWAAAGVVYLNTWFVSKVAEEVSVIVKQEMVDRVSYDIGTTEMLLRLTQAEIRSYQRDGLSTLNDQQEHKYETLKKAEEKLTCSRDKLLGIADGC